jgi:PAS domain S-box-containing protein
VSPDLLPTQIAAASRRAEALRTRAGEAKDKAQLFDRALKELDQSLEELRLLQEQVDEHIERTEALRSELSTEREKYWRLFNLVPDACLLTRDDSAIIEANRAASELLNISQRFLVGKVLSVFVCEERTRFLRQIANIARERAPIDLALRVRPRERAPLEVAAQVTIEGDGTLRWLLRPIDSTQAAATN